MNSGASKVATTVEFRKVRTIKQFGERSDVACTSLFRIEGRMRL